jgi:hypothetical protein
LINEALKMRFHEGGREERRVKIVSAVTAGIGEVDPQSRRFADGINIGPLPPLQIADWGLVESRGDYLPKTCQQGTTTVDSEVSWRAGQSYPATQG